MFRASMKVLFGGWFWKYCGKVCMAFFGGIFHVLKQNVDWMCLLFRMRTSRRWSVPLRWWKTSMVTSLKRSLWTMTSPLPSTSSSRRSGKWRQKLTGCPSAGLIPEGLHKRNKGTRHHILGGGNKGKDSKDFLFIFYFFGCKWWQGNYVSCLNTSEEVYLFFGTKVKEHRFAFFVVVDLAERVYLQSANVWLFSSRWECLNCQSSGLVVLTTPWCIFNISL